MCETYEAEQPDNIAMGGGVDGLALVDRLTESASRKYF